MDDVAREGCPGCAELSRQNAELRERVRQLEEWLNEIEIKIAKATKNSQTSSKPPSSDIVNPPRAGEKKRRSQRRKRGGQPGHQRHERVAFKFLMEAADRSFKNLTAPSLIVAPDSS